MKQKVGYIVVNKVTGKVGARMGGTTTSLKKAAFYTKANAQKALKAEEFGKQCDCEIAELFFTVTM